MKVVLISFNLCREINANKSRSSLQLSHSSEIGALTQKSAISLNPMVQYLPECDLYE